MLYGTTNVRLMHCLIYLNLSIMDILRAFLDVPYTENRKFLSLVKLSFAPPVLLRYKASHLLSKTIHLAI